MQRIAKQKQKPTGYNTAYNKCVKISLDTFVNKKKSYFQNKEKSQSTKSIRTDTCS